MILNKGKNTITIKTSIAKQQGLNYYYSVKGHKRVYQHKSATFIIALLAKLQGKGFKIKES